MEAIAASFVEGAVSSLVSKLSAMLAEESRVLAGVEDEVRYIKDELDSMSAFLRSAEQQQEDDPNIKAWVKQVRDLTYDAEDCVDTCALRLRQSDNHAGLCNYLRTLNARYKTAAKIQQIRTRTQDVSDRRSRYGPSQPPTVGLSAPNAHAQYDPRLAALFIEESELVGIDKPRDMLLRWLTEDDPCLNVISVVGMGGLGKTTLARKVYQSPMVSSSSSSSSGIFYCRAWITVSQSFDLRGLLRNMIVQLFPPEPLPPQLDCLEVDQLIQELRDNLHAKRYAIFFDDIWSQQAWDNINLALPENGLGSRIIVTTRMETVARHCSLTTKHIYRLPTLTLQESRDLLCKKLYRSSHENAPRPPPHLEDLCDRLLKKCGGLPLAVMTIGALLTVKQQSREVWQKLHDTLGPELEFNPSLDGLKHILTLSYNDLPYHLKPCFLYLSMFPEDFSMRRSRLLRLWIAEGFARERHGMTAKEIAGDYFQELVNRSLIQPLAINDDGNVRICRVHDVMLEVIISKSVEENFVTLLSKQRAAMRTGDKVRRLSVHDSGRLKYLPGNMSLSSTRSLIMFGDERTLFTSPSLRVLRVLDLEGCSQLEDNHLNNISRHFHLRYLSLRGTLVSRLPDSLGKLRNLETLDIRNTYITKLPGSIFRLQKLRYLLAGKVSQKSNNPDDSYGLEMPQGIGSLKDLETLDLVDISRGKGVMQELAELTQLRKLSVCGLSRENEKEFWMALEKMSGCLRSLRASALSVSEGLAFLESLSSPPVQLVSLKLMSRLQVLPPWIAWLKNVAEITLYGSELEEESLQILQALPSLIDLRFLWRAYIGNHLCFGAEDFRSLKILHLAELEELESIRFEEKTMLNLEKLRISNCPSLKESPSGIEYLGSLMEVEVTFVSGETAKSLGSSTRDNPRHPRLTVGIVY